MKTKLLAAAFLALFAGNAMADDAVVPTVHGSASGTSWVMNIGLENATDYVAFQMDVKLPEGVSAGETDENITLYDRLTGITETLDGSTKFVVSKNLIDASTNTYRIIGYNLGNKAVKAAPAYNDAMFKISLTSTEAKDLSAVKAAVSNAIFVKASGLEGAQLVAENGSLQSTNSLLGDANCDNTIDGEDAVQVVNYYLTKPLDEKFSGKNADITNDGVIDGDDFVKIVNVFLTK